jgi:hypothetical protein
MDQQLDQWVQWIQTKVITYSLITWHWITWALAAGAEFTLKTVRGIRDAHAVEHWVFRARNECPWPIKEGEDENPVVQFTNQATWIPARNRLYFREGGNQVNHSFNDVVTAELYNRDKSLQYDMSSFFHEFSWRSVEKSPSLYEVVLLFCLTHNLFFSALQLDGFTLEILTAEGNTILVNLDSDNCRHDFDTWADYAEDTHSEVSSVSASEI